MQFANRLQGCLHGKVATPRGCLLKVQFIDNVLGAWFGVTLSHGGKWLSG